MFDLVGRGDFKAVFGATGDYSKYRWVRSRYRWLVVARDLAEKGYRGQQALRGRMARLALRLSGGPETATPNEVGGA